MNNYIMGDLILYLAKQMKVESERKLKPLNIGIGQLQVLLYFYGDNSEPISQSVIAKSLSIDKANASRSVNKLIIKGFITADPDRTIKNGLKLTESGLNIKHDIFSAFREVYDKMTNGISEEELKSVHSALNKMKTNMCQ